MNPAISAVSGTARFWRWGGSFCLVLVLTGLVLPSRLHVEREIFVSAGQATIFALINDFRQMEKWSPKANDDPNARIRFSGPPRGIGTSITWSGQIVGQGQQSITMSHPYDRITSVVDLGDGHEATVSFALEEKDGMTRVVWSWDRNYGWNIAGRFFGIMQKRIIGANYEQDLARLAELAERLPRADFSDLQVEQIVVEAIEIAFLRTTSVPEAAAISEAMGDSYFEILSFIDRYGLKAAGAPISITRTFSGSDLVFDAAIPARGITATTPRNEHAVKIGATYAGPVIRVRHTGSYATLGHTHDKIAAYLAAMGIVRNGDAWESYISDPTKTPESELLTYVYYPIRNPD
ncbi:MAG: SRPBCC family protein [Proteobacteria bacterium]|nr:SRPBCC family protein [Pseudomonadota bacterium]